MLLLLRYIYIYNMSSTRTCWGAFRCSTRWRVRDGVYWAPYWYMFRRGGHVSGSMPRTLSPGLLLCFEPVISTFACRILAPLSCPLRVMLSQVVARLSRRCRFGTAWSARPFGLPRADDPLAFVDRPVTAPALPWVSREGASSMVRPPLL